MRHILLPRTAENIILVLFINFKMPTTVGILKFMDRTDFMLMRVELIKGFITLVPDSIGANPVFTVFHKVICL